MVQDVIGSVMTMNENGNRASPASILAKLNKGERSKLRVYIGAAAGVGKTYKMLADAHLLKKQGADIVIAAIEPLFRYEHVDRDEPQIAARWHTSYEIEKEQISWRQNLSV